MSGFSRFEEILGRLGKHRTGKSCLSIKRLEDIDLKVLRRGSRPAASSDKS